MFEDAFVEAVVADLRAVSADLLDPVLTDPVAARRARQGPATASELLAQLDFLEALQGDLLQDAERSGLALRDELVASPTPRHAVPPVDPFEWVAVGRRLVPRRWYVAEPLVEVDPQPLAWLLHVTERLGERLSAATARLVPHLDDVAALRATGGALARRAGEALTELATALRSAEARAQRIATAVLAHASWRIRPHEARPSPYPSAPSWRALRRLAEEILDPVISVPDVVAQLHGETQVADLPFLYERWCGLEVARAFQSLGWTAGDNPVPALLVGGRIELARDGVQASLWCQPTLASDGDHPSGLRSSRREASPDYLVITPGPYGRDAFVLDATLATAPERRAEKHGYLSDLSFDAMAVIAGVPVRRQHCPLRAWAAAPLRAPGCVLDSSDGRIGTVPMHPLERRAEPIRAWVEDVARHALAWGKAERGDPGPRRDAG